MSRQRKKEVRASSGQNDPHNRQFEGSRESQRQTKRKANDTHALQSAPREPSASPPRKRGSEASKSSSTSETRRK